MTGIRWALALSVSCLAAPAALVLSAPAAQAQESQGVNGYNVTRVQAGNARYEQQPGGGWAEYGRNGRATFSFNETGRDEWSVYLDDPSRGVQLQLDLYRRMVSYGTGGGRRSDLYPITGSARPAPAYAPPPHAQPAPAGRLVNAGPIRSQQDAEVKCPVVAYAVGGRWTGVWRTTRQGQMSVCEIAN